MGPRRFVGTPVPSPQATPVVARPALRDRLEAAAGRRVCLVQAGPGWGKTTALTGWLATAAAGRPWQQVSSPAGLLRAVVALRRHDAAAAGEVVLVLDDLPDLLADPQVAALVEDLCRSGPHWLHLVLVTRTALPFPLHRLRGQGQLAELDATTLAFTEAEVTALVQAATGRPDRALAGTVRAATGGWPAAVRMAVDALAAGGDPIAPGSADPTAAGGGADPMGGGPGGDPGGPDHAAVLRALAGPGGRLGEYLEAEVLGSEPPAVPDLLRRLAVVGPVTPALCEALGLPVELLPELARRGLVEATPGPEPCWSLSPVLRDFFLSRPGPGGDLGLPPAERAELHRRAARHHAGQRAYGAALRHSAEAGDGPAVAELLADHGTELVETGAAELVLSAAERTAPPAEHPGVRLALGYARYVRGQWALALRAFEQDAAGRSELAPGLAWRMGLIQYAHCDPRRALALFGRGRLDREDTPDEVLLLAWTAAAYRLVGDNDECARTLDRAVAAAQRCGQPRPWAAVEAVRAQLAATRGDRAASDAHHRSALQWAEAGNDVLQAVRIRVGRAADLVDIGLVPEALEQAELALRQNETCRYAPLVASARHIRGWAYAFGGDLDGAMREFAAAGEVFQTMGSRFVGQSLLGAGYVHRVRGELAQARAAYEEALAQAAPSHDVWCMAVALAALARVRAADDPAVARELADRAVALAAPVTEVRALLAQGWVALQAGDRATAAGNATRAAASARGQRDRPGLAGALELAAMASRGRRQALAQLDEAAQIWAEVGYPVDEAKARLVAARLVGDRSAAELAEQTLRGYGVRSDRQHAAGPLAVLAGMAPSIQIGALGVFRVTRDGEPVAAGAWRSKKARTLLKILIARRGRPVSRDQLTELLWPDEAGSATSRRLSVLLCTVRAVLAGSGQGLDDGPVVADRDVVWLDLGQVEVDVEQFLALAAAGLEAHARSLPQATAQLAAAEACYGGEFLADDPYQEWAGPLRDEARTTYAAVLRALVRSLGEPPETDRCIRYALRLLQHDKYEESAHLDLIRALVRSGRWGEAWRRYWEYFRLMTEIGVQPAPMPEQVPAQAEPAAQAESVGSPP